MERRARPARLRTEDELQSDLKLARGELGVRAQLAQRPISSMVANQPLNPGLDSLNERRTLAASLEASCKRFGFPDADGLITRSRDKRPAVWTPVEVVHVLRMATQPRNQLKVGRVRPPHVTPQSGELVREARRSASTRARNARGHFGPIIERATRPRP